MATRFDAILEPAVSGGFPALVTPRAALNQEGRILAALGLARKPLPRVTFAWLAHYYGYLAASLHFPFEARCPEESGVVRPWTATVMVEEMLPPSDPSCVDGPGLLCRASRDGKVIDVPLIDLEVEDGSRNAQLVEDYWYWFWNFRFDPQI